MVVGAMATTLAGMAAGILHSTVLTHTITTTATITTMVQSTTMLQVAHIVDQAATTSVDTLHTVVVGRVMVAAFLAWLRPAPTAAIVQPTELA